MSRRLVAVLVFTLALEAHTGTYGEEHFTTGGFDFSINASVGSLSDHEAEGREYAANVEQAKTELALLKPQLEAFAKRFRTGVHGYSRLRGAIVDKGEKDVRVDVLLARDTTVRITPLLRRDASKFVKSKLLVDLQLAQLGKGGLALPAGGASTELDLQISLSTLVPSAETVIPYVNVWNLLRMAKSNEAALRKLALREAPVEVAAKWQSERAVEGHFFAMVLVNVLDERPFEPRVLQKLATLPDATREGSATAMAMLLSDVNWLSGLDAIDQTLAKRVKPDGTWQQFVAEARAPLPWR